MRWPAMIDVTEHHDLHSGRPVWDGHEADPPCDTLPRGKVDVAIIGAGVMGSMVAERLTDAGLSVALVDRRPPAAGSTAASTALVMWAADVPLTQLAERIGMDEAARRWRRVHEAVKSLRARIDTLGIDCRVADRPTVYLEGPLLPGEQLIAEGCAHAKAGLPSIWANAEAIARRFGIAPCAGLISDDGFAADPVDLTLGMLEAARKRGATVTWPFDALRLEDRGKAIAVIGEEGEVLADRVVLAGGYERARAFLPPEFSLLSSYAIATPPGTDPLWREDAMIWQAADPYLYARADAAGRIVAGGEDDDLVAEAPRDREIKAKAATIAVKLGDLIGRKIIVDRAWAATFGASPDGLPAIGKAVNYERLWLAAGFGGNGVSFAGLGAELLAAEFTGTPDLDAECFDPYRFSAEK